MVAMPKHVFVFLASFFSYKKCSVIQIVCSPVMPVGGCERFTLDFFSN